MKKLKLVSIENIVYWFAFPCLFVLVLVNALYWENGYLYVQGSSNYWDWPTHFAYMGKVAYTSFTNWFSHNPLFYPALNVYPFFSSIPSGLLLRLGVDWVPAFIIPEYFYLFFLLLSFSFFAKSLSEKKYFKLIAFSLFIFSGSYGFIRALESLWQGHSPFELGNYFEYTHFGTFFNTFSHQLLPSRGLLLGSSVVFVCLGFLQRWYEQRLESKNPVVLLVGLLAGFLFWIHSVSAIGLLVISGLYLVYSYFSKRWSPSLIVFVGVFYLLIFLQFYFFSAQFDMKRVLRFDPFWMAENLHTNFVLYWFETTGLSFFLALVSLFYHRLYKHPFYVSILVFLLGHSLFLWFTYHYDNMKIFFYPYLVSCFLVTEFLLRLNFKNIWKVSLVVIFCLSGALEVFNSAFKGNVRYVLARETDVNLAKEIREHTSEETIILGGNKHNHWLHMFVGRMSLIAYSYVPWSYNFHIDEIQKARESIYSGKNEAFELIKKYKISYVIVGDYSEYPPEERSNKTDPISKLGAPVLINYNFFEKNFPVAFRNDYYKVYRVHSP